MSEPARRGQVETARLPGVIDTLSAGYGAINRQIWIILIPVLLDLLLWFGPQVSIAPAVEGLLSGPWGSAAVPSGQEPQDLRARVLEWAEGFNTLRLLSTVLVGVPSLVAMVDRPETGPKVLVEHWASLPGLLLGIALVGILLGCIYNGAIAQAVRDGRVAARMLAVRVWRYWLRALGLMLLLAAAGIVVGLPAAIALSLLSRVTAIGTELATSVLVVALVWVGFHLFFASYAIFVADVGPLGAVRGSVLLVQRNFWPALLLIGLITLISTGMFVVWQALLQADNTVSSVLGMLGNAYISSGLSAAAMQFYLERSREGHKNGLS